MNNLRFLILFTALITSCASNLDQKEKLLNERELELLTREKELLKAENKNLQIAKNNSKDTGGISTTHDPRIDWVGTWVFSDDKDFIEYTLIIQEKYKGMNLCTYNATGIQTFYELECRGIEKENFFELYYISTNDGAFMGENINKDKPVLSLKFENGMVYTIWNQLYGKDYGKIAFKKKK